MLWDRTSYLTYMTYRESKRPMFVELFGPLVGLEDEWRRQGASCEEIALTAFDFDYVNYVFCGGYTEIMSDFKERTLEETEEYKIAVDSYGRRVKLFKKSATIPLPLDYPVKNMDDWLRIKPAFAFRPDRIQTRQAILAKKKADEEGYIVRGTIPGGFDIPRQLMGEVALCYAFYDQPELVHDMIDTLCNTSYTVMDAVTDIVVTDHILIHEDLAGKSGPLIGPSIMKEFISPYFKKVIQMLKEKGTSIISVDSDGNIEPLLDEYIQCGINEVHPMEPAAGMDMVKTKKKTGHALAFKGGIDKMSLLNSKNDIIRELEYKLSDVMRDGGVAFGLDHRIPNGVSIENYRFYINTAREILGLPDYKKAKNPDWKRMAF